VTDNVSGEVYLKGQLERGIVPEDSVWEHGGGTGQEGCLLYLHKMNLELLRKWEPCTASIMQPFDTSKLLSVNSKGTSLLAKWLHAISSKAF